MKTVLRGRVLDEVRMDTWAWLGAVTWFSIFPFIIKGLARLIGWRHDAHLEERDGDLFLEERISLLGLNVMERSRRLNGDAPHTERWEHTDPRILVMGVSFLVVSWAIAAHLLVLAMKGLDGASVVASLLWFVAGGVVDVIAWLLWRRSRTEVVSIHDGALCITVVPSEESRE